jgi:F-type H+-transporting ATPase subunit b
MATILALLAQAEEATNDKADLYPHWHELVVGALSFGVLFFFMWKWVLPRINTMLEDRRAKIQGELEKAETTRQEADHLLADYRAQLANSKEEANRIIEEARKAADQVRVDIQAAANEEAQATVVRAQEEIRVERDRVFSELRTQVGEIAVELAGRVVGQSLDESAHTRLIDDYIEEVTNGNGQN